MAAGFTSAALVAMSKNLQDLSGIDDTKILTNVTKQLLTFSQISGDTFRRAQLAVLDLNAVINQGSVESLTTQSIQLGKALENPIAGMGALSRAGVTFTDVQKKQIENYIRQNDLASAQNIILAEIETKYGGQAEALNKATQGTQNIATALDDLQESAGALINITGIVQILTKAIKGWTVLIEGGGIAFKEMLAAGDFDRVQANMESLTGTTKEYREEVRNQKSGEIQLNQKLWQEKQRTIEQLKEEKGLNPSINAVIDLRIKALQEEQKLLSINSAISRSMIKAIDQYDIKVNKSNAQWTVQGKTLGQIKDRIQSLSEDLDNLEPDTEAFRSIKQEIESLNKIINEASATQVNLIDQTIKKLQTEMEIKSLTTGLSREIMESAKATLEALEKTITNDEDRLKLLREIDKLSKQIADTIPPEIELPDEGTEDFILDDIDVEGRKQAIEDLKRLRISAMQDEFAQREANIELEFERLNEHYKELLENRLIDETEFQEALENIQKAKENELANLSLQKFEAGLSAARSIGNVLHSAFGDNTLIEQLNKALEIAEAIAIVIKSISLLSTLLGNPAGAATVGGISSGGLAKGGTIINTGSKVSFSPWNRVPKFASGVKDFMIPGGFPNDSFPIRVQSGERVTITPAYEVPKFGGGGNSEGLLKELIASVRAVSMNVSRLELKVNVINNAPDVETQIRRNKRTETLLDRKGVKFVE
jgi:hypothetical protein